ncbi:hypothetical protein D3C87_2161480 [compost metagenome]
MAKSTEIIPKIIPDSFFQDIPWEFIIDDSGKVVGEVFLTLPEPPPRKRQHKWGTTSAVKWG